MAFKITPAHIDWSNATTLTAVDFQDVYHSLQGGADEAQHVYVEANALVARWSSLTDARAFVIAETGFGTGLNFLVTLSTWRKAKADGRIPSTARLQFVSVEKHPLTKPDLIRAWQYWEGFSEITPMLLAQYPDLTPGFHRIHLDDVDLTLIFDDATHGMNQLVGQVDCWFLDGFSPAKNPDMWQQSLFDVMAAHSHEHTTVSTFTVAQQVKEGLSRAGFVVEKVPGFGLKRHTLFGHFRTCGPSLPSNLTPWFAYDTKAVTEQNLPIAVIGAGIAGASTAQALIRRGYAVDVIEKQDFSAGPPPITIQGVLYVKLSASYNPHSAFYAQGFLYSAQQLNLMPHVEWDACGVIQTAFNETEARRQKKFLEDHPYPDSLIQGVSQSQSSTLSGVSLSHSGLYFPQGGWVNPISLCHQLLQGAVVTDNTEVIATTKGPDGWMVTDSKDKQHGPYAAVVVACSYTAKSFVQLQALPTQTIRGQKTFTVPPKHQQLPIKTVLCGSVYITPNSSQSFNFGATFQKNDFESAPRDSDNEANQQQLREQFPALNTWIDMPVAFGLVGFRCTSPDYMPIVGVVPDWAVLTERYRHVYRFKKQVPETSQPVSGLYCNVAHGSRGLSSALLSGEIVASMIHGDPLPVGKQIADHLNPARFHTKALLAGKL